MNLVKKSLILCIAVLLLFIGIQGAQSLWQVGRLSVATTEIVAATRVVEASRSVWEHFVDTNKSLRRVVDFVDVTSADTYREQFLRDMATLQIAVDTLRDAGQHAGMEASVQTLTDNVHHWLQLAQPHVSGREVTALPSYHRLEALNVALAESIAALSQQSAALVSSRVQDSQALSSASMLWTVIQLLLAVAVGSFLGWSSLRSLHRQLGADASEVARVTNAVATGDLTQPIQCESLPAASVMAATARMQQALQQTVAEVRNISTHLAIGANEIASGNHDLSQRTELQAQVLADAACTMQQLDATVRTNARNAAHAAELADQASGVAARGGEVVSRAVSTMRDINESSRRIGDIIGTIDGIAFQTNLLALNAAVEAARAGDQGRGFAVVAAEVRNLAQRSATAAMEIKQLISDSVARVDSGSQLINEAGQTMNDVVHSIDQVTSVMAGIRAATIEQSSGVAEVGKTVANLDQVTQQNAALAEQSAASAERLKAQAQQLVEAMSFFKLHAAQQEPSQQAPWLTDSRADDSGFTARQSLRLQPA